MRADRESRIFAQRIKELADTLASARSRTSIRKYTHCQAPCFRLLAPRGRLMPVRLTRPIGAKKLRVRCLPKGFVRVSDAYYTAPGFGCPLDFRPIGVRVVTLASLLSSSTRRVFLFERMLSHQFGFANLGTFTTSRPCSSTLNIV